MQGAACLLEKKMAMQNYVHLEQTCVRKGNSSRKLRTLVQLEPVKWVRETK